MTSDALPGADTKVQNSGPERTGPSELPSADALFGPLPKKELPSADALFGPLPSTKERYDEVQARYDAGKATDAEFDEARSAYTKEFDLGERIGHTWNDAKIGSGTWEFIKSVSKGVDALMPWGMEKHADRATANEIADRQNELDAKLISQAAKDAVEAGDVETLKALSEGRVKTPRAVSRGEEAVLKLKNLGKEVAAAVVGAVHGGGDVLMAVPAAISKGTEEVALAFGADDTASALNRGRRDIVGARESGINTMVEATGGSQEAASGGRLVGGVAVPVSVPGVQAALKAAGTVAKPVGQAVQKAIDVVSPATRKAFEATAALAGKASEKGISVGMDAGVAGGATLAALKSPWLVKSAVVPAAAGALMARNSVLSFLRSPKSYSAAKIGGLSQIPEMSGQLYAKIKDALVTPSQMVGEIASGAVGQSTGSLIGDSIASAAQKVEKMSSYLSELKKVRRAEILEGRTHATATQSKIENLSARVKSVEMGQKFLSAFEKMGAAQKLEALHGQLGDAITYAIMGAGAGTAMASGMTENPIEDGFGPGAMLGAAVALIGNGVRVKTRLDGTEEMILDHDVVRNGAADLVEAAAKEAQEAPNARIQRDVIAEGIDAQGFFDEVQPDGSTVRYTRTDRGIEGTTLQPENPPAVETTVDAPEPVLRKPGTLRIKPGSMTNTKVVEAAEARAAARRAKLKPEPDADTVSALTKLGYDKATAKATALKAQEGPEGLPEFNQEHAPAKPLANAVIKETTAKENPAGVLAQEQPKAAIEAIDEQNAKRKENTPPVEVIEDEVAKARADGSLSDAKDVFKVVETEEYKQAVKDYMEATPETRKSLEGKMYAELNKMVQTAKGAKTAGKVLSNVDIQPKPVKTPAMEKPLAEAKNLKHTQAEIDEALQDFTSTVRGAASGRGWDVPDTGFPTGLKAKVDPIVKLIKEGKFEEASSHLEGLYDTIWLESPNKQLRDYAIAADKRRARMEKKEKSVSEKSKDYEFTERDVHAANSVSRYDTTPEQLNARVSKFRESLNKKAGVLGDVPPEILEKIDSLVDDYVSDIRSDLSWTAKNPGMMVTGPAAVGKRTSRPKPLVTDEALAKFDRNFHGVELRRKQELNAPAKTAEAERLAAGRVEAAESVAAATKQTVATPAELTAAVEELSKTKGRTQQKAMANALIKQIKLKGFNSSATAEAIQGLYDDILAGKGYSNHLPNVIAE